MLISGIIIVIVHDSSNKILWYIDGKLDNTDSFYSLNTSGYGGFLLGKRETGVGGKGHRFFKGIIDEFKIYNRVLTANEVKSHAKAGNSKKGGDNKMTLKKPAKPSSASKSHKKDDGYRGIWYYNGLTNNEYVYKYSGGLGTYCAKHKPFAVYCNKVKKTFFCYGGTTKTSNKQLIHMVSYYDHKTGMVPRPTILLNKRTGDAHDNPVISVDDKGYIWIFSTSHGTGRPSYIHRSKRPYDIEEFELVKATKKENGRNVRITNFSYMQPWYVSRKGFIGFFTRYKYPVTRTICYMTSPSGEEWSEWIRIATIGEGSYQISGAAKKKAGTAFNVHLKLPGRRAVHNRTNLYYIETVDFGKTWQTAGGIKLTLPLTEVDNPALIHDYSSEGLNIYLKDIRFDEQGMPVILFITTGGYDAGPKNDPRTWMIAHWTGKNWDINPITTSDNNYDMGSLYIETDGTWRIIAPTETGPQPYNPGGEVAMWTSADQGKTWKNIKQLTQNSPYNHTYCRRPVNAHPDFYALWADGHGRQPSESSLYFCNKEGNVYKLPRVMKEDFVKPEMVTSLSRPSRPSSFSSPNLSPSVYHRRIMDSIQQSLRYDGSDVKEWQKKLRKKLWSFLKWTRCPKSGFL